MKNKLFTIYSKKLIGVFSLLCLLAGAFCTNASAQSDRTAGEMETLIDGIAAWKSAQTNTSSVQGLIDSGIAPDAGTGNAEWFIIGLRQYKNSYTYSTYSDALNRYVSSMKNASATDRQRIALAYAAVGGNAEFIQSTIRDSIGKMGVTSYIYGLILLDSGAYTNTPVSRDAIIENLLSLELSGGGWALKGSAVDVDVTAMAVQALAPYYQYADVKAAVDKALTLLAGRQLENGDYASWGTRNAESTAQVIAALSALNISCQSDSRFIKNGHTLIDGLLLYKQSDGNFSHTIGGASNNTASVQAMYSLIAAWRQSKGLGPLFRFTSKSVSRGGQPAVSSGTTKPSGGASGSTSEQSADNRPGQAVSSPEDTAGTTDVSYASTDTTGSGEDSVLADITDITETTDTSPLNIGAVQNNRNISYKVWACGAVILLALLAVGILFSRKKSHKKNLLLVAALTAAALLAVVFTNIQSVGEYYAVHPDEIRSDSKTVTLSIRCDTVADSGKEGIPSDGCLLDKTQLVLHDGDTVFDVLIHAAKQNKIQMDYEGGQGGTAYLRGIGCLYEKEFGDSSGWMYKVNGEFENVSCSDYTVSDGDVIEWVYTCDLGKDVGGE